MTVGGNVTPTSLTRFIVLPGCILVTLGIALFAPPAQTNNDFAVVKATDSGSSVQPRTLTIGETVSDTISAGETRVYTFSTPAGQNTLVEIVKGDLRLKFRVCTQQTNSCLELMPKRYGKLSLPLSTATAATYKLEVSSMEKEGAARQYELRLVNAGQRNRRNELMDDALRIETEAEKLRGVVGLSSQHIAASRYYEAARLWESAGEFSRAVESLCEMGDIYFAVSEYPQALAQYTKAFSLSQRGDRLSQLVALHGMGYVYLNQSQNEKALGYSKEMLNLIENADPAERNSPEIRRARAQALNMHAEIQYYNELQQSIGTLKSALSIFEEVGDRSGQALALLNLGFASNDLGNPHTAFDYFTRSLALSQSVDDNRGTAFAQTALGGTHSRLGDEQLALNLHKQAAERFRAMGNKQGEAMALNGIGSVYQDSNQYQEAFDKYSEALRIYEEIGNRGTAALNKYAMGKMLYLQKDIEAAHNFYRESLNIALDVGDSTVKGHALKGLATVYFAKGDTANAIKYFDEAQKHYQSNGNRRSEAYVLNDLGHVYDAAGDHEKALTLYAQALPMMRQISERRGEALTLFNTAKAEFGRNNLDTALATIENSISISESLRTKISNSKLRTSFFASVHEQYQLYIDVLMRLHTQQPDKGFNTTALVASERARARSLLDSLFEDRLAAGKSLANDLLPKEQELLRRLDEKAEYQTSLLAGAHTDQEANDIAQEIRALTMECEDIRSKLREQSPRLAALTQPGQLQAAHVQDIVRDQDTALLEFSLGDKQSYLWVVNSNGTTSYELPAREKIENFARKTYELLTARQLTAGDASASEEKLKELDAEYWVQATALSTMVLGPAADRLGSNRLLIVGDGFLRYIPFEALPLPNQTPAPDGLEPLFLTHEIVGLPSALILAALRSERSETASKTIAVIADPVYEPEDPRVVGRPKNNSDSQKTDEAYLASSMRGFDEKDSKDVIARLPSTAREAQTIMAMTPAEERLIASGFAANKDLIAKDELKNYRIIHFATHGLLNNESPELSGVVLSLVDEHGQKQPGFVRLHDIYSMDLSADLVVLSACRTGLGRNVQGEGIVGLTSGFMYAGAKSVVASLWKVDDDATAELMGHFYTAIFKNGLAPAAALNAAKREMWKQPRWRAPFYWAAFTLQGEYTTDLAAARRTNVARILTIAGIVTVAILGIYAFARYRRRAQRV